MHNTGKKPWYRILYIQVIIAGLKDGTLEVIATDHAPHGAAKKARPFEQAPNGIIGLETLLPVCVTAGYPSSPLATASAASARMPATQLVALAEFAPAVVWARNWA